MSTIDQTPHDSRSGGRSLVVRASLTSDGSGDASVSEVLHGWLVRCVTNPGATAPTDNWDLTLVDPDGVDVLEGGGADRDTANSEIVALPNNNPVRIDGALTVTGANMGDTKDAEVVLYLTP